MGDYVAFERAEDVAQELNYNADSERRRCLIHRNTLLPVSKLPPEILCSIFQCVAPTPADTSIAFSQVCYHWRKLALNDPRLWRSPIVALPELAVEMARRASGLPLDISADFECNDTNMSLRVAALAGVLRSGTVERLELLFTSRASMSSVKQFTDLLALTSRNTLRFLHIEGLEDIEIVGIAASLDCVFPLLRHICWVNYRLPWTAGCYSNLHVLEITLPRCQLSSARTRRMNTDAVISVLRRSPNLTRLVLVNTMHCDAMPDRSVESTAMVSLPNLTELELHDTPYHLQCLLSFIEVPNLSKLVLWARRPGLYEKLVDVQPLLRLIADKLAPSGVRYFQSAKFQLTMSHHIFKATSYGMAGPPPTTLQVSLHVHRMLFVGVLDFCTALAHRLSLDRLERLTLKCSNPDDARLLEPLCSFLAPNPSLTKLKVISYAYLPFLECLRASLDQPSHFRSMKTLHIMAADLAAVDDQHGSGLQNLAGVLRSLKDCGRPVAKVVVRLCIVETPATEVFTEFGIAVEVIDEMLRV